MSVVCMCVCTNETRAHTHIAKYFITIGARYLLALARERLGLGRDATRCGHDGECFTSVYRFVPHSTSRARTDKFIAVDAEQILSTHVRHGMEAVGESCKQHVHSRCKKHRHTPAHKSGPVLDAAFSSVDDGAANTTAAHKTNDRSNIDIVLAAIVHESFQVVGDGE